MARRSTYRAPLESVAAAAVQLLEDRPDLREVFPIAVVIDEHVRAGA